MSGESYPSLEIILSDIILCGNQQFLPSSRAKGPPYWTEMCRPFAESRTSLEGARGEDPLGVSIPSNKSSINHQILTISWIRNWGLTDHELKTIPPSLVRGFMKSGRGGFGGQLPGNFGRLLMRDEYNSELYGPLQEEYIQGKKAGTDFWIHKNR